jgi:hypothetical protein
VFYTGDKAEFEEHGAYCKECLSEHAMCPKCGAPYHSASFSDWEKILEIILILGNVKIYNGFARVNCLIFYFFFIDG